MSPVSPRQARLLPSAPVRSAASAGRFRSRGEVELREAVVRWGRARWPDARVMHELPMGRCRVDVAFVGAGYLAAVEVKAERDTLDRLPGQVWAFRAALPELWVAVAPRHLPRLTMLRHLFPSVGVMVGTPDPVPDGPPVLAGVQAARVFRPHPAAVLELLHTPELVEEVVLAGLLRPGAAKRTGRARLLGLLSGLTLPEVVALVARQLRGRATRWTADPARKPGAVGNRAVR